jgi:plastocyanin domain-containing protein
VKIVTTMLVLVTAAALAGCAQKAEEVQPRSEVVVLATSDGFEPAEVVVPKGQAATIVFRRTTDKTCATEAVFVENGAKHNLPLNQDVRVELAADRPDSLHWACGMNMWKGVVVSR